MPRREDRDRQRWNERQRERSRVEAQARRERLGFSAPAPRRDEHVMAWPTDVGIDWGNVRRSMESLSQSLRTISFTVASASLNESARMVRTPVDVSDPSLLRISAASPTHLDKLWAELPVFSGTGGRGVRTIHVTLPLGDLLTDTSEMVAHLDAYDEQQWKRVSLHEVHRLVNRAHQSFTGFHPTHEFSIADYKVGWGMFSRLGVQITIEDRGPARRW